MLFCQRFRYWCGNLLKFLLTRQRVVLINSASAACEAYLAKYNLGGGNWTGGQLFEQGQPVGHVSYNGRVWDVQERCVYDPFAV